MADFEPTESDIGRKVIYEVPGLTKARGKLVGLKTPWDFCVSISFGGAPPLNVGKSNLRFADGDLA